MTTNGTDRIQVTTLGAMSHSMREHQATQERRQAEHDLAALLDEIEAADTLKDYDRRNAYVYTALAVVARYMPEVPHGIAIDEQLGAAWPLVYIELPGVGQVSWHVPAYKGQWDQHTTAQKYARCRTYRFNHSAGVQAPAADWK